MSKIKRPKMPKNFIPNTSANPDEQLRKDLLKYYESRNISESVKQFIKKLKMLKEFDRDELERQAINAEQKKIIERLARERVKKWE